MRRACFRGRGCMFLTLVWLSHHLFVSVVRCVICTCTHRYYSSVVVYDASNNLLLLFYFEDQTGAGSVRHPSHSCKV